MEEDRLFLVKICSDLRIQRLLWRPVTMVGFDEHGAVRDVQLIERPVIVCDGCRRGYFEHLIDCVDGFLDLLADASIDFRVKPMDYGKIKSDAFEFCRYYSRRLGNPLMERLKHEIYEILEEAIDWWGRQEIFDAMEG